MRGEGEGVGREDCGNERLRAIAGLIPFKRLPDRLLRAPNDRITVIGAEDLKVQIQ